MTQKNTSSVRQGSQNQLISTQRYLQFSEVHDDTLILKNGGLRAILDIQSVNFNLKSAAEQGALISSYQGFLNALNFPVQIQVRSRKLDIDVYIADLKTRQGKIENDLLREQMSGYIDFIQRLVEYSDIMEKKFFVVVPLDPIRSQNKSVWTSFLNYIQPEDTVANIMTRKREFKNLKKELDARVNTVKTALENCGLGVTPLKTEQIIQVFYQAYNPDLARTQKFSDSEKISVGESPSDNLIVDEK
jgi:hypothetical protein